MKDCRPVRSSRYRFIYLNKNMMLFILLSAVGTFGCGCSKKKSDDEQRLKKRIDVTSVHLYASAKAAISEDSSLGEMRDNILKNLAKGGSSEVTDIANKIDISEMVMLGKAVLNMKEAGRDIVRGKRDEGEPLIPLLLKASGAPSWTVEPVDRNTDHGMLFMGTALLNMNGRSPMPIPSEVVLYEAWRTDAAALKIPGLDALVFSMRSLIYGNNDFCDLAEADSRSAERASRNIDKFVKGIALISEGKVQAGPENVKYLPNAIRALANAGPAVCYYKRGDDKSARPKLKTFLDEVRATGFADSETMDFLNAFYLCGGDSDEVSKGKALAAKMSPPATQKSTVEQQLLAAYCDASAGNKLEIARKISFAAKVAQTALASSEQSGIVEGLKDSKLFKGTMGLSALAQKAASSTNQISGAVDALKGLFKSDKK
jgi:hypothetical protein